MNAPSQHRPRRRWVRAMLVAAAVLVVAAAVVGLVFARWAVPELQRSLSAGLRMPVSIGGLGLHPWTGAVSVGPVTIGSDADVLRAARLSITPQLGTLWHNDIVIERVEIADLAGVLHLDENYQPVFRTVLTGDSAASSGKRHVTIRELVVDGGTLTVRYPVGKTTHDGTLQITRFHAANLDFGRAAGAALNMSGEFEGSLDGAPVQAKTDVRLSDEQPGVALDFSIKGLRVDRTVVALPPQLETLTGVIDIQAKMEEGGAAQQHALQLAVRVADAQLIGKEGSAVSAQVIALPTLRINMADQVIDLGPITLEKPALVVRLTDNGLVLPIASREHATTSSWTVTSGDVRARGGTLGILRDQTTTNLTLTSLRWDGLRRKGDGAFELEAAVDDGSITANGTLTTDPQAVAVDATFDKVPLPPLAQLANALPVSLSQGTASGSVTVHYAAALDRFAGRLALHDVHTAPPDPAAPVEVMAVSEAAVEFSLATDPVRAVDVSSLKLSYPYIMVRRRADGVFPYSAFVSGGSRTRAAAPSLPVRVDDFEIENGKVEFLDATLEPVFWSSFTDVAVRATQFHHPELTVEQFTVAGKHDELSPTAVSGSLSEQGLRAQAELKDVLLETLNAYVSPALGYRITSGRVTTTASAIPSPPLLQSTVDLVLSGVDVYQTGPDIIQEQSGVPLPVALSLISDLSGAIRLSLPIAIDTQFQSVSFGSVFWQAFRQAILNALTSPLRLLGSLFGKRNAPHAFAIDPIPFAVGRGQLDQAGRERIAQIERILQAHPGLMLVLLPQITGKDAQTVGAEAVAQLAAERNASVRDAFIGAASDPLPPDRVILAPWKPETAAAATGKPGVYIELQDAT